MRLNKISDALRKQGKGALYTSAMLSMLAAPAYAQAAEEAQASAAADDVEVIEVRGMRGTMTRSLNEKKNTAAIVDAIAAADFGDLPGLSLSDVIENVSGASGHRLKGSQNEISIRGLGSYWGYSTFNGRTITNAGSGRAVNFKKFPSDLVDKITIYKSQQADLVEGGTSGTIEVGSLRAVDYGKSKTSIEYQAAYNDYYSEAENQSEWGHKVTFSTVHSWETDNFGAMGFSFGYVQSDSANPEENYGTSSTLGACSFKAADGSALSASGSNRCSDWEKGVDSDGNITSQPTMVSPGRADKGISTDQGEGWEGHVNKFDQDSIFYIPDDSYWRTGKDEDERRNIVTTFQWVPNDSWDVNFDLASSRLEYTERRMELAQERAKYMVADSLIIGDEGTLLYEEGRGKSTLQGESRNQVDDYDGYGLAVDFQATDNLELSVDASYSESYRYRLRHRAKFRSEGYQDYSLVSTSDVPKLYFADEDGEHYYNNVNGELVINEDYDAENLSHDVTDITSFLSSDGGAYLEYGRENDHRNDDIWAVKFDGTYTLDDNEYIASIKAGVRYSREHLYDYSEIQTAIDRFGDRTGVDKNWNSDFDDNEKDLTDFDVALPEHHVAATNNAMACGNNGHSLEGFLDDAGGAGQASDFYTFDSKCMIGAYLGAMGVIAEDGTVSPYDPNVGFYDIGENPDKRDGQLRDVREDITAIFVMANIDTEVGGYPVTGNVGMRYVKTETKSKSYGETPVITETEVFDPDTGDQLDSVYNTASETTRLYLDDEYTEYLPSMNLTIGLTDEWFLKTAAYRAMSRFAMNAMSAGVTMNECSSDDETECDSYDSQVDSFTAKGNMMNPYTSENYDLSLEWYPSQDMAITLAGYWKNFTGGTEQTTEQRVPDVINIDPDGNASVAPYTRSVATTVNQISDDESTIKGFELTFQKHFVELPEPFNGIGVKGAWNHAISDFQSDEPASPGLNPDSNLYGFSSDVASASIYWEGEKLSMRAMYKYRSSYFQPNNLPFPYKVNREVEDSEYLDAAVKYKFTKNFEVSLKALNLLEEPQVYTRGGNTVSDYSFSGRKFFLSAKAKF